MSARYVIASFADEEHVLEATRRARTAGYVVVDVHTPYPVHGLEHAMGLAPSRLGWACLLGGALGCGLTLYFQYWTSALDWPLNVGGKPYDSLPAFVPIAFEMTVLFGGLGVVAAFFVRCRMWPGSRASPPVSRVTDDRFALVLRLASATHSLSALRTLFVDLDAVEYAERIGEVAE